MSSESDKFRVNFEGGGEVPELCKLDGVFVDNHDRMNVVFRSLQDGEQIIFDAGHVSEVVPKLLASVTPE